MEREVEQEPSSIVHIQASEAFPKKVLTYDDPTLTVPFPTLPGESVEYLGRTSDGVLALSNYRLFVQLFNGFCNVPLGLVEHVECRDIFFLHIYCKDAKSLRCTFSTNEHCVEWHRRLQTATSAPKKLENIFACAFYTWCKEGCENDLHLTFSLDGPAYSLEAEMKRMGFDKNIWKISHVNEKYNLCSTYPEELIVPINFSNEDLEIVASFRSSRRIPTVVWKHRWHGTVIARCSQPEVGLLGWRRSQDENLVHAIAKSSLISELSSTHIPTKPSLTNGDLNCSTTKEFIVTDSPESDEVAAPFKKLLILDARSYAAAVVNRAKGGGSEFPEYYPNCEIQFMNLANIHSIRKSFHSVRTLCSAAADQANWFSVLESTKWLHCLSALLKSALVVVNAVDRDRLSVLVHCSDGWDRTPQIVALAELMLDPYYRTMEGFQVLVEREWLAFGHKFADRCGHSLNGDDSNERCPVFLQWLDCVYQLITQFPCCFEFTEAYLIKLAQHVYSCLFGTFLCNSEKERKLERISERTYSIWAYFRSNKDKFYNLIYVNKEKVLRPAYYLKDLRFWATIYLPTVMGSDESNLSNDAEDSKPDDDLVGGCMGMTKTRSCDDLLTAEHAQISPDSHTRVRRNSDPSLLDGSLDEESSCVNGDRLVENTARNRELSDDSDGSEESPDVTITSDCYGARRVVGGVSANGHTVPLVANQLEESCNHNQSFNGEDEVFETNEHSASENDPSFSSSATCCLSNGISNHASAENGHEEEENVHENLTNGHENSLEEYSECQSTQEDPLSKNELAAFESSTDTLCGELANAFSNKDEIPTPSLMVVSPNTVECQCVEANISENHVQISGNSLNGLSVSTSTSDISNSIIYGEELLNLDRPFFQNLMHKPKCQLLESYFSGTRRMGEWNEDSLVSFVCAGVPPFVLPFKQDHCGLNGTSKHAGIMVPSETASTDSTPAHSRTSSSGLGTTPSEDRQYAITHQMDSDGLTQHKDDVHHRLQHLFHEHQRKVDSLNMALRSIQSALCQQVCCRCNALSKLNTDNCEDVTSTPESGCSADGQSIGPASLPNSDLSWEHVDETDAQVTLWVPDHISSRCMACGSSFWFANSRHHCRSCGRLFCGNCSKQTMALPGEQLYTPVRVCDLCYSNQPNPPCNQQSCQDGRSTAKCIITASTTAASN